MARSVNVLAIDGPAGAGKSTVARRAAERLDLTVLDTGAMYRAVTLACLRRSIDVDNALQCTLAADAVVIEQHGATTRLDGEDVSAEIRLPEVTAAVSAVSAHAAVREVMVKHQRAWVDAHGGGVVEGRDIGTVVFPDARLKVFLVAADAERARRRQREEVGAGREVSMDAVAAAMARRDELDSQRDVSPLTSAPDAVMLDTTSRTIDEVVEDIVRRFEAS